MSGEIHGPAGHPSPTLVPSRNCEGCAVCCMLFDVPQVEKKAGEWCRHCGDHLSCGIHATRPQVCRDFYCFYLREPAIPDYWQPKQSHMVIVMDMSGMRTLVHVDPAYPNVWRSDPYFRDLKTWSRNHIRTGQQVYVSVAGRMIAILPDREEDLGVANGRVIRSRLIQTTQGPTFEVEAVDANDPCVQPGYVEPNLWPAPIGVIPVPVQDGTGRTTMAILTPVRGCDGCTMCCKVMNVPELEKPAGTWCRHCEKTSGCAIHATRPSVCSDYFCAYILNDKLGPEWKPATCKFVISYEAGGGRVAIYADLDHPDSWRAEPYFSTFRAWAEAGVRHGGQVVVFVGRHAHVILPGGAVDLGVVAPDELILTEMTRTPEGIRLDPFKASKDDPRAQAVLARYNRR